MSTIITFKARPAKPTPEAVREMLAGQHGDTHEALTLAAEQLDGAARELSKLLQPKGGSVKRLGPVNLGKTPTQIAHLRGLLNRFQALAVQQPDVVDRLEAWLEGFMNPGDLIGGAR